MVFPVLFSLSFLDLSLIAPVGKKNLEQIEWLQNISRKFIFIIIVFMQPDPELWEWFGYVILISIDFYDFIYSFSP